MNPSRPKHENVPCRKYLSQSYAVGYALGLLRLENTPRIYRNENRTGSLYFLHHKYPFNYICLVSWRVCKHASLYHYLLTSNKSSRVTWFFQKLWPVLSFSSRIIRLRSCQLLARVWRIGSMHHGAMLTSVLRQTLNRICNVRNNRANAYRWFSRPQRDRGRGQGTGSLLRIVAELRILPDTWYNQNPEKYLKCISSVGYRRKRASDTYAKPLCTTCTLQYEFVQYAPMCR